MGTDKRRPTQVQHVSQMKHKTVQLRHAGQKTIVEDGEESAKEIAYF
jgi:hypothetical protein